jgi:hypothetical protein
MTCQFFNNPSFELIVLRVSGRMSTYFLYLCSEINFTERGQKVAISEMLSLIFLSNFIIYFFCKRIIFVGYFSYYIKGFQILRFCIIETNIELVIFSSYFDCFFEWSHLWKLSLMITLVKAILNDHTCESYPYTSVIIKDSFHKCDH